MWQHLHIICKHIYMYTSEVSTKLHHWSYTYPRLIVIHVHVNGSNILHLSMIKSAEGWIYTFPRHNSYIFHPKDIIVCMKFTDQCSYDEYSSLWTLIITINRYMYSQSGAWNVAVITYSVPEILGLPFIQVIIPISTTFKPK